MYDIGFHLQNASFLSVFKTVLLYEFHLVSRYLARVEEISSHDITEGGLSLPLLGASGKAGSVKAYQNHASGFTTDISCNAGDDGKTILVLFSHNTSAANATTSAVYMLRCGYGGNNLTPVEIAKSGSGNFPTFTVESNGYITVDIAGAYTFIMNK